MRCSGWSGPAGELPPPCLVRVRRSTPRPGPSVSIPQLQRQAEERKERGDLPPSSAAVIADAYRATASAVDAAVRSESTEVSLTESVAMYGETWTRAHALYVMLVHEIHHRGQLTVLMRHAGLTVPGIYGPAREEWATYGMEIPRV